MKKLKKLKFERNKVFDFLSIISFGFVLFISFLIYARLDSDANMVNGLFKTEIDFSEFNDGIDRFFTNFFSFGGKKNEEEVDAKLHYQEVEDHIFKSEDQTVRMLGDGVITYIAMEDDASYSLVVNIGSIRVSYFNLTSLLVKPLDHLKSGEVIGEYEETFKVYFYQNGENKSFSELSFSD